VIRETPHDRARQVELKRRVERAYGLHLYDMPTFALFDYLGRDGHGRFSVWEFKCPHKPSTLPRVLIDVAKVEGLLGAAHRLGGVPAAVVYGFDDGEARLLNVAKLPPDDVTMGGRTDRADPDDIDPVCWFRVADMVVVP